MDSVNKSIVSFLTALLVDAPLWGGIALMAMIVFGATDNTFFVLSIVMMMVAARGFYSEGEIEYLNYTLILVMATFVGAFVKTTGEHIELMIGLYFTGMAIVSFVAWGIGVEHRRAAYLSIRPLVALYNWYAFLTERIGRAAARAFMFEEI